MAVLVGIDEAGYGPILGPLVVSASVFELPDELLTIGLWEVLGRSVCRTRKGSVGRLVINDSKKLHHGLGQYHLLQRGVLSCIAASGKHPLTSLAELLDYLGVNCREQLAEYPWYADNVDKALLKFDQDDIATAATALAGDLQTNKISLKALWSHLLFVGQFNQMVQAVNNKYKQFGRDNLQIVIDRHGGRTHYRAQLQRIFPDMQLKILKEEETLSSYHLWQPNGSMKIHFLAKGDARQLPIALSSMTSKYLRELFMEILNSYFQHHCGQIAPTAGYYKDGKRFLDDLQSCNLAPAIAPRELLVRQR